MTGAAEEGEDEEQENQFEDQISESSNDIGKV